MTNAKLAVADLHKFMLGFDRMFHDTSVFAPTLDGGYPRFNILRVGETGFRVELAVPGWNKDDLEISLHKGLLTVSGNIKQVESSDETYVYKGLSGKCFSRTFGVSEHVKSCNQLRLQFHEDNMFISRTECCGECFLCLWAATVVMMALAPLIM
jgi:HSP20 family molecular chaperone IbpA